MLTLTLALALTVSPSLRYDCAFTIDGPEGAPVLVPAYPPLRYTCPEKPPLPDRTDKVAPAPPPRATPVPIVSIAAPAKLPPVQVTPPPPLPTARPGRPQWSPYLDVTAGLILGGRRFAFNEEPGNSQVHCYDFQQVLHDPRNPSRTVYRYGSQLSTCPGFSANLAGGLRLEASAYPLAGRDNRFVRGLGLAGLVNLIFWPDSRVCDSADPACIPAKARTGELRVEAGLRWAWNILNQRGHPSLLLSLSYGLHQFSVDRAPRTYAITSLQTPPQALSMNGQDDHGLPDLRYQYIDIAVGGRIPLYAGPRWYLGMLLNLHYHAMLDYGEIGTQFPGTFDPAKGNYDALYQGGGYGPVSAGHGVRIDATPLELVPWRGLLIRLSGYYEWFDLNFDLARDGAAWPPADRAAQSSARHLAQGATDQYFGGILQLGYQY